MNYQNLLQIIEVEITGLFQKQNEPRLAFHNLTHTRRVVAHCFEIAADYDLSSEQLFIVQAAAWFHDIGYLYGPQQGHEQKGAQIAGQYLERQGTPAAVIEQIQGCILATRLPQQPSGLLQQIVCDADLFHFGTRELIERDKLMRTEVETRLGNPIQDSAWLAATIGLLESHQFQTSFAITRLLPVKQQNLALLKSRLQQLRPV